ncbi:MAG: hypothetical protein IJQ63_11440 [Synergistaceae bacterium]|nr:hypothetical protein [Synergistaceae bacterium]MBR0222378.1 hypothetical protein [Synergistaceae bacterium]
MKMKKLSKIILAAVITGVMSIAGTASADDFRDFRTDKDNLIIRIIQGRIERKHRRDIPRRLRRRRRHMPPPPPEWRRDRRHRRHMPPPPPPPRHHGRRLPPPPRHRR